MGLEAGRKDSLAAPAAAVPSVSPSTAPLLSTSAPASTTIPKGLPFAEAGCRAVAGGWGLEEGKERGQGRLRLLLGD